MEQNTKENGRTIYKMVKVLNIGLMDQNTKVITKVGKNRVMVNIFGMINLNIKENGTRIQFRDMENIIG